MYQARGMDHSWGGEADTYRYSNRRIGAVVDTGYWIIALMFGAFPIMSVIAIGAVGNPGFGAAQPSTVMLPPIRAPAGANIG